MRDCLIRTALACIGSLVLASQVSAQVSRDGADEQLRAIYTAQWKWWKEQMAEEPDDERPGNESGHLPQVDGASQEARLKHLNEVLADLNTIDFPRLSAEEKVNAQVFRAIIEERISDLRFKTYQAPFNADSFFWTEFTPREGFPDVEEYRKYLSRLSEVPRFFDQHIANMRAGLARGFTVPKPSVIGRDKTIEPYVATDTTNPLYVPFTQMPAAIPKDEQERLQNEARVVIAEKIAPAYQKLLTFIRNEYLVKARTTLAASKLPDGAAFYQARIKKFTTLELTPAQIHEIGLGEVARIKPPWSRRASKARCRSSTPSCAPIRSSMPRPRIS
jgi:uncharacterized protein (DUF885 family)